jgi:hypothetical protein
VGIMRGKPGLVFMVSILLGLSACGGDGGAGGIGGGTQPPPAMNRPPAFTSAATVNAPENGTGTIYTAIATDPDGNVVTFSLSGGADRAAFAITAAGALSFVQPPDFEAPTDADQNNVYLVQVAASDGVTSATLDLAVTVTNVGPDAFHVTRVGTGFASPLYLTAVPDGSGAEGASASSPRRPARSRRRRSSTSPRRPPPTANAGCSVSLRRPISARPAPSTST